MKKEESLDIEQAALLLRIPRSKVRRWVQQGQIPCKFKGNECSFKKKEILEWARAHNLKVFDDRGSDCTEADDSISLRAGIEKGGVYFELSGDDFESAFQNAVDKIPFPPHIDKKKVLEALVGREKIASTGIGKGVAIPHPRRPLENGPLMIPVFFLDGEIDMRSVDGKPVSILFFLFSPTTQVHLNLLSKLSFCLRESDFLGSLRKCSTSQEVLKLIQKYEDRLNRQKTQ